MTLSPRAVLMFTAALSALAAPAMAQTLPSAQSRSLAPSSGAAATLPNSFDAPVAAPVAPAAPAAPAAAPTEVAVAEATLRAVIEQLRAGEVDTTLYTADLAGRLKGQIATLQPILVGFGAVQSVEALGSEDGTGQFLVVFDEAATQWMIGLNEDGLIAALLFRPAPPESSTPNAPPAT
ncbi:hypothetical protein BZG35_03615 [Brevundimonas sp. LM2]|uniref:hypothetical protein n=1 Tax=Brevundimonas sp. LM2 TaxID=1938605 RepID=UPI000983FF0D|nr:hypothetical protein [Brevundimonas sp. LM2]AQR60842.1 hypothetical protein BZG35_03615 [Brevundimonas sp. LM2]